MKTALVPIVFFTLVVSALADEVQVYFSPADGPAKDCTSAIIREVKKAKTSIKVEECSFTRDAMSIARALVRADRKKIQVEVILDRGKANIPIAKYLDDHGIALKVDSDQTDHNTVMIIDGETVITGSYNVSNNAEHRNRDSLVVIHGKETAQTFAREWQEHFTELEEYEEKLGVEEEKLGVTAP